VNFERKYMKKQMKEVKLPRMNCDAIAKNLKKGLGRNKALSVADNLARSLSSIGPADCNTEMFPVESLKKRQRIWQQVRNILTKMKG
jgi:hypothetical protein